MSRRRYNPAPMCTLLVAVGLWPAVPLLVAANRDEAWRRRSEEPLVWKAGERRVFGPRDAVAGGTWLGLNDRGLFVGVTNRFGAPPDSRRRSRGLAVVDALAAADRKDAIDTVFGRGPKHHNPFHLAVADRQGLTILWDDGKQQHVEERGRGVHVLTERSFGADASPRDDRLADIEGWLIDSESPPLDELQFWLSGHGEDPLDGPCVHAPQWEYGTRSSTVLWMEEGGRTGFQWAGGAPCESEWRDLGAEAMTSLRG